MNYEDMRRACEARRVTGVSYMLSTDPSLDLYAYVAVLRVVHGVDEAVGAQQIGRTARWFELPHPDGRDPKGECDFVALQLASALYCCYDRLDVQTREWLDRFFLEHNFFSKFGSENHALMGRVALLLAAQFYRGRRFLWLDQDAAGAYAEAKAYILEFLSYRAARGWGEFDSCGYNAEDMAILGTLYTYAEEEQLRTLARMHMDVLLLDMIVDSKCGVHGGAHARIYPAQALDGTFAGGGKKFFHSAMYAYYCYYFGAEGGYPEKPTTHSATLLSNYYPSEIVCRIAKNRVYPYENRERRHLHQSRGFRDTINRALLDSVEGLSIDKYTYVCEEYMLGSVNHQDEYPEGNVGSWYAHHEQHEWELTLMGRGEGRAKIFSHHPGNPGYYQIHNHWTGDSYCNCGTHFCTANTAISMYDIKDEPYVPPKGHIPPDEAYLPKYPVINACIPLTLFDESLLEGNYVFLRYDALYVMVWFSNGYRFVTEGETAGFEALSDGWKHCFICHVDYVRNYASLSDFAAVMKQTPIAFDPDTMRVEFMDICMDYRHRWVKGELQHFPYRLFDSPFMRSEYGTGVYRVSDGKDAVIYDFNKGECYVDRR